MHVVSNDDLLKFRVRNDEELKLEEVIPQTSGAVG
jgi:hypothetical protein